MIVICVYQYRMGGCIFLLILRQDAYKYPKGQRAPCLYVGDIFSFDFPNQWHKDAENWQEVRFDIQKIWSALKYK